jgi:hypothetical protein
MKRKKLTLNRDTVRLLDSSLADVHGGRATTGTNPSDHITCFSCATCIVSCAGTCVVSCFAC